MFAPHRLIVGLNGERRADPHLVRYAAMIARLGRRSDRHASSPRSSRAGATGRTRDELERSSQWTRPLTADMPPPTDPEIRFVLLGEDQRHPSRRAALRSLVGKYFAKRRRKLAVGCDLFKHRAIARLPELAHDFDSELVLVDDSAGSRRSLARLAERSPCPVWLVPPRTASVLRRILVPIDFTHGPVAVLRTAAALARRFPSAKCIALHVDRPTTRFATGDVSPRRRDELLNDFETLLSFVDFDDVMIEPLILQRHDLARAIAEATSNLAPDLTVLTARGRHRHVGRFLPNHSGRIIRDSSGPLLILRTPAKQMGLLASFRHHWREAETPTFS